MFHHKGYYPKNWQEMYSQYWVSDAIALCYYCIYLTCLLWQQYRISSYDIPCFDLCVCSNLTFCKNFHSITFYQCFSINIWRKKEKTQINSSFTPPQERWISQLICSCDLPGANSSPEEDSQILPSRLQQQTANTERVTGKQGIKPLCSTIKSCSNWRHPAWGNVFLGSNVSIYFL